MQLHSTKQVGSLEIRFNWLVFACVLITAAAFIRLGVWQLDRAGEKVELQRALEVEKQQSAIPVESLSSDQLDPANEELHNLHVVLRGEYLNDRTILLAGEFFDGIIGYGVVTPFRLASNGQLLLVSRGWTTAVLPPGMAPELRPVEGPVEVSAQIYQRQENDRIISSEVDASHWPLQMRSLELDVISSILDEALFPYELRITAGQPGTLARHWPAVNVNVNVNLGYALQWFSFALIVLLAALFASSNLWYLLRHDR